MITNSSGKPILLTTGLFGIEETYSATALPKPPVILCSSIVKIIFFGKILPYKGLDILIDAIKVLNSEKFNFHCYIVGEGLLNYQGASDNISIFNKWVEDDKLQEFINDGTLSIYDIIAGTKNLKELIQNLNTTDSGTAINIIETRINNWIGNIEQIDDITLLGIQIIEA